MFANIFWYFAYFITDIVLLLVAGFAYIKFTPYDEIALIRERNAAAAIALAGAMLGYSLVIYTATVHGTTIPQVVLWSIVSLAVQIGAFELMHRVIIPDNWKRQMEDGSLAHGIALGAFSLVVGIINAACLNP